MILGGDKLEGKSVTEQVAEYLISHVSNSSIEKPIIKINENFGVDISVTKHLVMLWIINGDVIPLKSIMNTTLRIGR